MQNASAADDRRVVGEVVVRALTIGMTKSSRGGSNSVELHAVDDYAGRRYGGSVLVPLYRQIEHVNQPLHRKPIGILTSSSPPGKSNELEFIVLAKAYCERNIGPAWNRLSVGTLVGCADLLAEPWRNSMPHGALPLRRH